MQCVVENLLLIKLFPLQLTGNGAALEHVEAVTHPQELGQLGGDEDDPNALLGKLTDEHVDLVLGANINALGRLVHDHELDVLLTNPAANHHLLLVAAYNRVYPCLDEQ